MGACLVLRRHLYSAHEISIASVVSTILHSLGSVSHMTDDKKGALTLTIFALRGSANVLLPPSLSCQCSTGSQTLPVFVFGW